jgi:osomolarity two-component system response regulator SSK1
MLNLYLQPVNFAWMERKVTEWGCMQALIDFDGWRKWKDYASSKTAQQEKDEKAAARAALKAQFAKRPSTKAVKAGA